MVTQMTPEMFSSKEFGHALSQEEVRVEGKDVHDYGKHGAF